MDDALRAADRDRDDVAAILREQYAQGRLTMEEYDERSTAAASAKTMGDLRVLTADLPATPEPSGAPAWSRGRMRWIAVAGVLATVALLVGAAFAGHFLLAFPTWLVVLIIVRHAHGGRRFPQARGPRTGRG
ncbi:DUF1707 domain-containing protein [Actinomadura sp. DC4]|uniref:DUF1707 SHOCT-like domain-containing protein n=1 Tax=Actinomadura sp. DC4 TaxID=3055069 RepID=UPI0025B277C3|nr:DUF1707 domain-containing protein [Actinomadura sp. DC4]MDN3359892.1 DUF1707 domain-containing protein [Actinomadura sp. DC4]